MRLRRIQRFLSPGDVVELALGVIMQHQQPQRRQG